MGKAVLLELQSDRDRVSPSGKMLTPEIWLSPADTTPARRTSPPDGSPMRVTKDERRPYRQTEPFIATMGSPTGGNTYGDRVPVVAQRLG